METGCSNNRRMARKENGGGIGGIEPGQIIRKGSVKKKSLKRRNYYN